MYLKCLAGFFAAMALTGASHAEWVAEVEGAQFPSHIVVEGTKLTLNGAAVRRRSFIKPDAVGLYLPAKANTLEAAVRMPGPKSLRICVLRELTGATISRYFINDFKLVSTDAEFKLLINEISQIGAIYGALPRVAKGDVVDINWIPGKGVVSYLNGKPLSGAPIPSEKMYEITMRIVAGVGATAEMRERLLGNKPTPMVEASTLPAQGRN
jgi:hypothetical protein